MKKEVSERKINEVKFLVDLVKNFEILAIASLDKVRAIQIQELVKKLGSDVYVRVFKNNLAKRAIMMSKKPNLEEILKLFSGSNIFLFTNMNPFMLSLLLDKSKIRITAKAGDKAQNDIIVHAGNTGLPPGPVISELNDVGIRSRIKMGSVHVIRDTVVVKGGETISPKLAGVLSRLGIKPLEVRLKLAAAYDSGSVLTEDQLHVNLEEVRMWFEEACSTAINLSVNAVYPTSQTIIPILRRAWCGARNLSIKTVYPASDVILDILGVACIHAQNLVLQLTQINSDIVPSSYNLQ